MVKLKRVKDGLNIHTLNDFDYNWKETEQLLNEYGLRLQDIVAKGQLTPSQYATLIQSVNGLISKGEITIDDLDKNNFVVDETLISDSLRSSITGGAPIHAVPADGSLTSRKFVNKSVTPSITSFMYVSDNKFNPDATLDGKSIDVDGTIINDASRWLSPIIDLPSSKIMSLTPGNYRVSFHDENGVFLGRGGLNDASLMDYSADPTTMKIRLSATRDKMSVMLNDGSTLKPFVEFEQTIEKSHLPPTDFSDVTNVSIHPENEIHFKKSNNIFNKNTMKPNKTIAPTGGNEIDEVGRFVSDFNPVTSGKNIHVDENSTYRYQLYDKDKNPVSGRANKFSGDKLITTTFADVHYIKISPVEFMIDGIMMNQGTGLLPKDDYGFTLVSTPQVPIKIAENIVPAGSGGGGGGTPTTSIVGSHQIFEQSNQNYSSAQSREVYSTTSTSELDYIEVSSNSIQAEIILTYIDENGAEKVSKIINTDNFENAQQTVENIINYGGVGVQWLQYDEGSNNYKLTLNNLKFSDGFKLSMRNAGDTQISIAVQVAGRYYV